MRGFFSLQRKGTAYAAKLFSDDSRRLHMKYVKSEIMLLRDIPRHDNIVQLIALEKEVSFLYGTVSWNIFTESGLAHPWEGNSVSASLTEVSVCLCVCVCMYVCVSR